MALLIAFVNEICKVANCDERFECLEQIKARVGGTDGQHTHTQTYTDRQTYTHTLITDKCRDAGGFAVKCHVVIPVWFFIDVACV